MLACAVTHRKNQRSPSPNLHPQIPERGHRQRGSFRSSITVVATTCMWGQKGTTSEAGADRERRGCWAEGQQFSNGWETHGFLEMTGTTPKPRMVVSALSTPFSGRVKEP